MVLNEAPTDMVIRHYDRLHETYGDYATEYAEGLEHRSHYPGNFIRLRIVMDRLRELQPRSVLDVGCGEGTPLWMISLEHPEARIGGFDLSPKMVESARRKIGAHAWVGDALDPGASREIDAGDVTLALGPAPHMRSPEEDLALLRNLACWTHPGGRVFVEHKNELFALFTRNWYTYRFQQRLMEQRWSEPYVLRCMADEDQHLKLDQPTIIERDGALYEAQEPDCPLRRLHNVHELPALYAEAGLRFVRPYWYHYHPVPPMYEREDPETFRRLALAMEDPDDWRGHYMASAFVAEAVRE